MAADRSNRSEQIKCLRSGINNCLVLVGNYCQAQQSTLPNQLSDEWLIHSHSTSNTSRCSLVQKTGFKSSPERRLTKKKVQYCEWPYWQSRQHLNLIITVHSWVDKKTLQSMDDVKNGQGISLHKTVEWTKTKYVEKVGVVIPVFDS